MQNPGVPVPHPELSKGRMLRPQIPSGPLGEWKSEEGERRKHPCKKPGTRGTTGALSDPKPSKCPIRVPSSARPNLWLKGNPGFHILDAWNSGWISKKGEKTKTSPASVQERLWDRVLPGFSQTKTSSSAPVFVGCLNSPPELMGHKRSNQSLCLPPEWSKPNSH